MVAFFRRWPLPILEEVTAIAISTSGGCHTPKWKQCTGGSVNITCVSDALSARSYGCSKVA